MKQSQRERIPYQSMRPGKRTTPVEIRCPSCGAPFLSSEARCPYCGAAYLPAAEQEYMEHLEDVREDLGTLRGVAAEETGQEIRRSGRLARRLLVILLLVIGGASAVFYVMRRAERARDREEYLWRSENFPILDQYYEAGDYDAMVDFYEDAAGEHYSVYEWKHGELARSLREVRRLDQLLEEAERGSLPEEARVDILYYELSLYGLKYRSGVPEEDRKYLEEVSEPYLPDMEQRFGMTQEEKETFDAELRQNYGFPQFDSIRKYLKEKQ